MFCSKLKAEIERMGTNESSYSENRTAAFLMEKERNDLMLDFTPLVQAVIALAASAITVFLVPWLRERYGNETLEKARGWVQIAVYAAEKLYGAGNGDQKLAYAEEILAKHKIKLDTATLKAMVDAEIKKMENNEFALLAPEEVKEDDPNI